MEKPLRCVGSDFRRLGAIARIFVVPCIAAAIVIQARMGLFY
jgi:hypothetical protein